MAGKAFDDWARGNAGYVSLVLLGTWAAGVTEYGDIALFIEGYLPSCSGRDERGGQYLLCATEAMSIAKTLVRAVALADAQASAPQVIPEPKKTMRVKARASSPVPTVVPRPVSDFSLRRPAATIFF